MTFSNSGSETRARRAPVPRDRRREGGGAKKGPRPAPASPGRGRAAPGGESAPPRPAARSGNICGRARPRACRRGGARKRAGRRLGTLPDAGGRSGMFLNSGSEMSLFGFPRATAARQGGAHPGGLKPGGCCRGRGAARFAPQPAPRAGSRRPRRGAGGGRHVSPRSREKARGAKRGRMRHLECQRHASPRGREKARLPPAAARGIAAAREPSAAFRGAGPSAAFRGAGPSAAFRGAGAAGRAIRQHLRTRPPPRLPAGRRAEKGRAPAGDPAGCGRSGMFLNSGSEISPFGFPRATAARQGGARKRGGPRSGAAGRERVPPAAPRASAGAAPCMRGGDPARF